MTLQCPMWWQPAATRRTSCTMKGLQGLFRSHRPANIGALAALNEGAELLAFLDVDCIPGRSLLGRYYEAGVDLEHRDALLCGPVTYLPHREARKATQWLWNQ